MTENEYFNAWINYILGVSLLFACWWYLTSKFKWVELRHILRVVLGVSLVVPWYCYPNQPYLAPAWIIVLVEGLFDGGNAFWRAGIPLITALSLGVSISFIFHFWRSRRAKASVDAGIDTDLETPTQV